MQLASVFLGSRFVLKSAPAPHVNTQAPRQVTCMAKKKGVRCIVTLECTEARGEGQTPSRYTTQKNRKNTTGRMELKKYNKYLKRHTVHKEIK